MKKIEGMKHKLQQNSPAIKTGIAVGGIVSTTALAIAATPEAHRRMEDILEREHGDEVEIAKRVVKEVLPLYIPTALSAGMTIYCILSSHKEMSKRNAILAGLYTASEGALQAYQKKAIEKMGEKWHNETVHDINEETLKSTTCTIYAPIGKVMCYDKPSGRYFPSDMQTIRKAENDINREVNDHMYESLNRFYELIGLAPIPLGDDTGWSQQGGYLDVQFDAQLNENDEPVMVINYATFPIW